MDEQSRFRTALAALSASAEQKDGRLTKGELQEFFQEMNLEEEKQTLVYMYLSSKRIQVEGVELPLVQVEKKPYTKEEQEFLKQYVRDLQLVKKQRAEDIHTLIERAADGDQQAKALLTEHCMERVLPIAQDYAHRGLLLQDLVQEGNLGLMIGLHTLGLKEEELSFEAYLDREIHRAIRAALDEQEGSKSMGEQIAVKLNRLADAIRELTEDMGRQVTPEEVSLYVDMPLEEIENLLLIAGESIELAEQKKTPIRS